MGSGHTRQRLLKTLVLSCESVSLALFAAWYKQRYIYVWTVNVGVATLATV